MADFARRASVRHARLRAAFSGPSKSGKTYDSLVIATSLIKTLRECESLRGNGRILVIDSESGRSEEQYGDIFDFDIYDLADFSPEAYIDVLDQSKTHNYSLVIVDQISHEWAGKNGALEITTNVQTQSGGRVNSFMAWGTTTPRHNKFIETLVRYPAHLICTMRSKMEFVVEQQETKNGMQWVPRKIGLQPVQRDSTEYEFDIVGTIDQNHILSIETRGSLSRLIGDRKFLPGPDVDHPGEIEEIGRKVGLWIADRATAKELLASREQVDEIQELGDKLGLAHNNWKKVFEIFKIPSLSNMTPEIYEKIKADMTAKVSKAEAKRAKMESASQQV